MSSPSSKSFAPARGPAKRFGDQPLGDSPSCNVRANLHARREGNRSVASPPATAERDLGAVFVETERPLRVVPAELRAEAIGDALADPESLIAADQQERHA